MKAALKNRKLAERLEEIGLSPKATTIYAALLELGTAVPSRVAEYTKINRTTVYTILAELAGYGLISEFEHNKKLCYQVEQPVQLLTFAESQVALAQKRLGSAQRIFPEIEGILSRLPNRPKIRYFEGVEGVMEVYRDHVQQRRAYEMAAFGNAAEVQNFFSKRFLRSYVERKMRLKITTRAILPDSERDINYNQTIYQHVPAEFWPVVRHVPKEIFTFKSEITMYGNDRVSVINFQEQSMVGIIIEDATIHGMMRMIFELAWRALRT